MMIPYKMDKMQRALPSIQYISPSPIQTRTKNYTERFKARGGVNLSRVSTPGIDWLKCAFAAPDFPALTPVGIPDKFTGRTLVKQFRYDASFNVQIDQNREQYILILPIPGYSHFKLSDPASAPGPNSIWIGVPYSDATGLFGAPGLADNQVTSFRYMSQLAELVPTTNAMTWTGSIEVYKVPIRLTQVTARYDTTPGAAPQTILNTTSYTPTGLQGVESTNCDRFSTPSHLGVFANATSDQPEFNFVNVQDFGTQVPVRNGVGDLIPDLNSAINKYGTIQGNSHGIVGFGEIDSIVIKLSGVTTDNTFRLKTWATMEFTVNTNSALYEYSIMSPNYDAAAIAAYHNMVRACPIAVTYYENANFWQTILKIANTISGALSFIPGPVGAIAGGINQLLPKPR
jgi:hypothetical protein